MATPYQQDFNQQAARDRARGNQAEDTYISRASNFDARGAARDTANSMYEDFAKALERSITDLRGSQVGRGRTRTGWGWKKEDQLVADGRDQLTRDIAGLSLQAEGLNLRNLEGIGAYGTNTTNRYLDILAGNRDAALAEQDRKRRDKAGLWGLAGRVGGALLGPAASAAGGALSDYVAGLFN